MILGIMITGLVEQPLEPKSQVYHVLAIEGAGLTDDTISKGLEQMGLQC